MYLNKTIIAHSCCFAVIDVQSVNNTVHLTSLVTFVTDEKRAQQKETLACSKAVVLKQERMTVFIIQHYIKLVSNLVILLRYNCIFMPLI